jgi:hypothetical protein
MIDRLFTATLAFALLAGATIAIGSALFGQDTPAAPPPAVAHAEQGLPRVGIVVGRQRPGARVAASDDAATPRAQ